MDDRRRQQRKDRKTTRSQKRAEKKAARASAEAGEEPRASRIAKLMRARDDQLGAVRARLAEGSAFTAADLGAARALLQALDVLLDVARPSAVLRVHEASALLVAEAAIEDRALGSAASPRTLPPLAPPLAPPPAPAEVPEPGAAAAKPVQVPSFLRDAAPAAPPQAAPPPPRPVPAAPSSAPAFVAPPALVSPPPPVVSTPATVAPAGLDDPEETTVGPVTVAADAPRKTALGSTAVPLARSPAPTGGLPFAPGAAADPLQRFPLAVYASVCAEVQAQPQLAGAILARYGLGDPKLREAVDRGHKERLAADPTLRRQFDDLLARALATLRPR